MANLDRSAAEGFPCIDEEVRPIRNFNLEHNLAEFGDLYGGETAPEPEVVHTEPAVPLPSRMVTAACRVILRAKRVKDI